MERSIQRVKEDIRRVIKNYNRHFKSIDILDTLNIIIRGGQDECRLYKNEKALLEEIYRKPETHRDYSDIVDILIRLLDRVTEYIAATDGCNLYICPKYFDCNDQEREFVLLHEIMHILRGDTILMPFLESPKNIVISVCGARVKPINEIVFHGDVHIEVEDFDVRYLDLLPVFFNVISDAQINMQLMRYINISSFSRCRPIEPNEVEGALSWFYSYSSLHLVHKTHRMQEERNLNKPTLELVYLLFQHLYNLYFRKPRGRP